LVIFGSGDYIIMFEPWAIARRLISFVVSEPWAIALRLISENNHDDATQTIRNEIARVYPPRANVSIHYQPPRASVRFCFKPFVVFEPWAIALRLISFVVSEPWAIALRLMAGRQTTHASADAFEANLV
jgi:hypothetical protein